MRESGSARRDPLLRAPDFDSLPGPLDLADRARLVTVVVGCCL